MACEQVAAATRRVGELEARLWAADEKGEEALRALQAKVLTPARRLV